MRTRSLTALLFTSLLASAAPALTIDNFEEGDFTVTDTSPPLGVATLGEQSGLSSSNTAGGVRLVRSLAEGTGSATAALTTTGGDDSAALSTTTEGNYSFIYDGIAGGNTNSGSAGTLNLDLSTSNSIVVSISTPIPTAAVMRMTLWDATSSRSTAFRPVVNGDNSMDLTGGILLLDLTSIKAIQIALQQIDPATGLTISNISAEATAVPEPTTALLLSLGIVGFAVARRR
jgi:PEP-CTERM motif-containing protein